jgi:Family of unknown function (DUF6461)
MAGLMWLAKARSMPTCMTFVRGADERAVLAGLGVDPGAAAIPPDAAEFTTPGISIVRPGPWVAALEDSAYPRGKRPEVLRRVSAGTEAVVIYQDLGKGDHEFAHAVDGEIITAVTTSMPPHWRGSQPDRLRPLAEELGLAEDSDYDLSPIEVLLVLGETVFGLTLDEEDLRHPLLRVPDPAGNTGPWARGPATEVVDTDLVRAHVRRLVDRGVSAETIAARAGMTTLWIDRLLSGGQGTWMIARRAERILAIEAPPQSAP